MIKGFRLPGVLNWGRLAQTATCVVALVSPVYGEWAVCADAIESGWANWSRSSDVNFSALTPVIVESPIAVNHNAGGAGPQPGASCEDRYFLSGKNSDADPSVLPYGSASDRLVDNARAVRAGPFITMRFIGWTTKSREKADRFGVAEYGPQQDVCEESLINRPIAHVPTMRGGVEQCDLATEVAISRYNLGGQYNNRAITRAESLGVGAREGFDLDAMWSPPTTAQPAAFAFRTYRSCVDKGSAFGSVKVDAMSTRPDDVSVYGSLGGFSKLAAGMINKTFVEAKTFLAIIGFGPTSGAGVFRYSNEDLGTIIGHAPITVEERIAATPALPTQPITLIVVRGRSPCPWDLDGSASSDGHGVAQLLS